jgi:hypothetical protein
MRNIDKERKKKDETFQMYANRLWEMASCLTGGERSVQNGRLVLASFCDHAIPEQVLTVKAEIDADSDSPLEEMERGIRVLCRITGSDGITKEPKYNADINQHGKRKQNGEANQAEARYKKPKMNLSEKYKDAICRTCGVKGHTTNYHPTYEAMLKEGEAKNAEGKEQVSSDEDNIEIQKSIQGYL